MDDPDSSRATASIYMRVIALSIAFYDYFLTLPAEWRFYKSQRSWRLSPGCLLFIAIRYSSILVLVSSNVGFFGQFFTQESCETYFMLLPVLKVLQTAVSQLILGIRTVNISRRASWVLWTVAVAFIVTCAAEAFLNLWNRVPVHGPHNNCTAGNRPPLLTAWLYYVFAIAYDIITLCISTMYLMGFGSNSASMGRLVRVMLSDGLVYFVALTGANILNLIFYRSTDEAGQSSGVSLGYALTWIMSQRILIHLRDAAAAYNRSATTQIVVTRPLASAYAVSRAMRSHFDTTSKDREREREALSSAFDLGEWSVASHPPRNSEARDVENQHQNQNQNRRWEDGLMRQSNNLNMKEGGGGDAAESEFELDVQVQIEEMVTIEYDPEVYERESYRTPRVLWPQGREESGRGGEEGARPWSRSVRGSRTEERNGTGRSVNGSHLADEGAAGT